MNPHPHATRFIRQMDSGSTHPCLLEAIGLDGRSALKQTSTGACGLPISMKINTLKYFNANIGEPLCH